jgi:pimeloyl-ACP methyl ester carboxylesterase
METRTLEWNWQGQTIRIGADSSGSQPQVLLLPALSSISTRHEMHPLQQRLAEQYSTICVDWPGFGNQARPQVDWRPAAYSEFLSFLLTAVVPHPCAIIAAGHAAIYALKHTTSKPQAILRLAMIAPTWRGPLPTMMGGYPRFLDRLCRLVDLPALGTLIYRLNVNATVVRRMAAGHVYADAKFPTGQRLRDKLDVVRAPGARFASVRFVCGGLDPLDRRDAFLDLARRTTVPILLIYGADTPSRSRAEMEALAALPAVRSVRLPRGKLSLHEEFPDAVMESVTPFLSGVV